MVSTQPPSGFRDFLNHDALRRLRLSRLISDTYESFGFLPVATPAVENLEVLLGSGGGQENEKLIFKILKRGDKLDAAIAHQASEQNLADLGLRFDLTVPLSRLAAQYAGQIITPWKVFHIGQVYRAERAQKGRFREFTQCDVDIVGGKGVAAEIEVIQAVAHAVDRCGAKQFELKINHRELLRSVAVAAGFKDKQNEFSIVLDKLDKIGATEVISQLQTFEPRANLTLIEQVVAGEFTLEDAAQVDSTHADFLRGLIQTLDDLKLPLSKISYDPSLARGLAYYTGAVFELRHPTAGYSLGGGGRYDQLMGRFAKQSLPACGFSIGFDRLLLLLEEQEAASRQMSDVLFFTVIDETMRSKILTIAARVREKGRKVDVYADQAKLKAQLKYADDKKFREVCVIGPDEFSRGEMQIKNFETGTTETQSIDQWLSGLFSK